MNFFFVRCFRLFGSKVPVTKVDEKPDATLPGEKHHESLSTFGQKGPPSDGIKQ